MAKKSKLSTYSKAQKRKRDQVRLARSQMAETVSNEVSVHPKVQMNQEGSNVVGRCLSVR